MQWYRACCSWQASATDAKSDGIKNTPAAGATWCYIGLAYNLYLLKHNVEIQARLLKRLRDPDPRHFQGAYYELIVAGILIRAGFHLVIEDEQDVGSGHCEFSAIAPSGKKYWVEAKMRSVAGVFGVTKMLGGSTSRDATEKVTAHLRQAFQKPAPGERFVFIDVNAPNETIMPPAWCERAAAKLTKSEKDRDGPHRAYVFLSNMNFHHHLSEIGVGGMVMAYGYGIDDFAKEGQFTFSEYYRNQQKHQDAIAVLEGFKTYTKLPTTFDGSLASDRENPEPRPVIGEKYLFGEAGEEFVAEVTSAIITKDKEIVLGVLKEDGQAWILKGSATDQQVADFQEHGEAYFGRPRRTKSRTDDPYELFLWFLENFKGLSKEALLRQAKEAPDIAQLSLLSQEDLAIALADRQASAVIAASEKARR